MMQLYYSTNEEPSQSWVKGLPVLRTEYVLSQLNKYTEYMLEVLAYNMAGDGPNSTAIYCKTDEDGKT